MSWKDMDEEEQGKTFFCLLFLGAVVAVIIKGLFF